MGGIRNNSTATGGDPAEGAHGDVGAAEEVPGDATIKTEAEPRHQTDKIARQRGMLPIRRPTER